MARIHNLPHLLALSQENRTLYTLTVILRLRTNDDTIHLFSSGPGARILATFSAKRAAYRQRGALYPIRDTCLWQAQDGVWLHEPYSNFNSEITKVWVEALKALAVLLAAFLGAETKVARLEVAWEVLVIHNLGLFGGEREAVQKEVHGPVVKWKLKY
jgi:hypothetical protein